MTSDPEGTRSFQHTIACPELVDQLTVEAWVDGTRAGSEAMQVLVSKWRPPDAFGDFAAHDAGRVDGLNSTGYFGAVFDGQYVYFAPEMHGDASTHGNVLRLDTQADFRDPGAYAAYDASRTDGLDTRGYYGAAFDGAYVYFVPRQIGLTQYHSRILRLDTRWEFGDPTSWAAHDVGEEHSQQSAAFDGRFMYFCPGFRGDPHTEDSNSGRVIRLDTQADFRSPSSYTTVDTATLFGPSAACYDGGAFDGRFIYFIPLSTGMVVRYDTRGPFDDPSSWEAFDATAVGMGMNVGAVFDGTHLYFCAYRHPRIVRFDTRGELSDPACWQSRDVDHTEGLRTCGFDGGFFDGRFTYFQPFIYQSGPGKRDVTFHSHYLRYDPTRPFDEATSWQARDASATDGLASVGYNGGAFDGRYFYAAPWQQGPDPDREGHFRTHGIVLRCDTLGEHGSFSLRYCDYGHNGGLSAAVPGPSFVINTSRGALSAAAHRALSPGRHHLAGTYDGREIKLFVDGRVVARRRGTGQITRCEEPVVLGRMQSGLGHFRGEILRASADGLARSEDEIRDRVHGDR